MTKIYYYKRKKEAKVEHKHSFETYDKSRSGSLKEYELQGSQIEKLRGQEAIEALEAFEFAYNEYLLFLELAKGIANQIWTFELTLDFSWIKDMSGVQVFNLVTALIVYRGLPIDFIRLGTFQDLLNALLAYKDALVFNQSSNFRKYEKRFENLPKVFHNSAAGILAHELLGHMLEADNYYRYNYADDVSALKPLELTLIDNPLILDSPGYYSRDDMGIKAESSLLIENGLFSNLIGCSRSNTYVSNALRRESPDKPCLPRMSNLLVDTNKLSPTLKGNSSYIQIYKLSKCFFFHDRREIVLNVDFSLLRKGEKSWPLLPFRLAYSLDALLIKIKPYLGGDRKLRPVTCSKQKQLINCGVSSPDWLVS